MDTYYPRNKKNIFVQSLKTNMTCQNVFCNGEKLYNALQLYFKNIINVETLTQKLKMFAWIRLIIRTMTFYFQIECLKC